MLTLDEYQKQTGRTDKSPGTDWYYALGTTGEAGEVAELIKKKHRRETNGGTTNMEDFRTELVGEIGDVMWYLARLATHYDLSLNFIAHMNLEKLAARQKEGFLLDRRA